MEKQSTRKFLKLLIALVALFLLAASALMLASCKEHVHQYELDESKSTNATCNQAGSQTFVCPECGDIYVNVVPATGQHTWEETKVYPASCESEGWTVFTCSVCGTQKQDNWTPKLTHKYEVAETHEATCTTDGYQIFECSFCGDRYTDSQYTAEHPKLGHDWGTNTDTEDTATSAADKLKGWYTVSAADCLNAQVLERKCARCGETEKKVGTAATGHKVEGQKADETLEEALARLFTYDDGVKGAVCAVNEKLVDAEGNAVYAFECVNENCPVNVVVDNRENTKHYIKAVDHKMEVTSEETFCATEDDEDLVLPSDVTTDNNYLVDRGEGKKVETCELCGTVKETDLEPTGHNWNTVQFDEKSAVISCEADEKLTRDAYLEYMRAELGNQAYAKVAGALTAYYTKITSENKVSRVCADCGALDIATGHDYVVSPLQEGKYGLNDYQVDENGLPVDSGLEASEMDCRYVQVCANGCGKVLGRGSHGDSTATTCREYGRCEVCGEQTSKQLAHQYISVGTIIANKDNAGNTTVTYANKTVTWKQAYDAYTKVSATETWMTPKEGNCTTAGTDVTVCLVCLLDAANGTEFTWNQNTTKPENYDPAVSKTNAYVITTEAQHAYEKTYFAVGDTTLDNPIDKSQANCQFGFQVAYVCSKCGDVYKNELVAQVGTDNKPIEGAKKNEWSDYGYTNSVGFILDVEKNADMSKVTEKAISELKVDNNEGKHLLYIPVDYKDYANYTPSNCISSAEIPVVCVYCGATLDYTYTELSVGSGDTFTTVGSATEAGVDEIAYLKDIKGTQDAAPNKDNHAGTPYACGTHCNYHVGTTYCGKVVDDSLTTATADAHATVAIDYKLSTAVKYYQGYSVKVATIGANEKLEDAKLGDATLVSKCADNKFKVPEALAEGADVNDLVSGAQYLVLVDAEGNFYAFNEVTAGKKPFTLYADDGANAQPVDPDALPSQDDTYFVQFESTASSIVTTAPVVVEDETSFDIAMKAAPVEVGKEKVLTVKFSNVADTAKLAITDENADVNATKVVYDLNGATVNAASFKMTKAVEIKNGTLVVDSISVAATNVFAMNKVTLVAGDNGVVVTAGANVTIADSKIDADLYGVKVTGTVPKDDTDAKVAISNTTIVMNVAKVNTVDTVGAGEDVDNTALYVSTDAKVTVTGSDFTANRQVVVVRGGDVTITNTKLNLLNYTGDDKTIVSDSDTPEATEIKFTEAVGSYDEKAYTDGFVEGFTENDYRLFGAWGENNEVAHAAIVAGESTTDNTFKYVTILNLSGVTFTTAANDNEAKLLVVGAMFDEGVATDDNGTADKTDDEPKEMVYVKVVGGDAIEGADFALCYNYLSNVATILGAGGHNGSVE